MQVDIPMIVARWSGLERPLFKGKLINKDGCKCAQGDVLSCAGFSDEDLRNMEQNKADIETAKALGISITHSVLLRSVNDRMDGAPQIVLTNPEEVIGNKAEYLLAFWFYLDTMPDHDWYAARAAGGHACMTAGDAAWEAAEAAAGISAGTIARAAAGQANWDAGWASSEIQGMDSIEAAGHQPYFLAFFGLKTWDQVRGLVPEKKAGRK